ncbi:MAG: GNAT family N-acetyltransferase [Micavibrio sp.]|nr:GNAT family N-acetyltransferase [Micavibrio sp.]|tara:strand:- start:118 stop:651 length:534 start_codon:yes stop_codon:yes gene_type:complete
MPASKLIRPIIDVEESYLEALAEFHEEGRYLKKKIDTISEDFDTYVELLHQDKGHPEEHFDSWTEEVPQTVLWFVKDMEYLGTLNIRHRLNWHLEKWGGHITFVIRPSKRGLGFGRKILQKGLPIANALGLDRALLTVPTENEKAQQIVEFCGGELQDTTSETENFKACHRYWIDCT